MLFNNKSLIDSPLVENLIKNLPSFVDVEFWNNKEVSFGDLSYGEKILNRFFYNLFYFYDFYQSKGFSDFKIILDELEIGLHPEWQKRFLSLLVNIGKVLSNQYPSTNIHFILASHSAFLLSDLPRQNVIFLDRNDDGNCTVVDGLKKKKETFGANIHTLLSDGFFMDDGLIGEFAKNKIQDVINFLNDKPISIKTPAEAISIIKIVSEPFLKKQLEEMYSKKFPKDSYIINRVLELKEEIKRLEDDKNR